MNWHSIAMTAAFACATSAAAASAQTQTGEPTPAPAASAVAPAPDAAPPAATAACADCVVVPPMTPVQLQLMTTLGSAVSKTGDTFPFRLAHPIYVNGKPVIPAGATGLGEVVHAKKSGGAGAAGELVLAARYLEIDGRRLRLRSLQTEQSGESRIDTAMIASTAALGLFGFLIKGGKLTIAEGSIVQAKTAEPFSLTAPLAAPSPEGPAPAAAPVTAAVSTPQ